MLRCRATPVGAVAGYCMTSVAISSSAATTQRRGMKVRQENYFRNEAVPHARRVSWGPLTTAKKEGVFAKLSRSNFYDTMPLPYSSEPYSEEQVEAHRAAQQPDVYIYKYTVTPTAFALRP